MRVTSEFVRDSEDETGLLSAPEHAALESQFPAATACLYRAPAQCSFLRVAGSDLTIQDLEPESGLQHRPQSQTIFVLFPFFSLLFFDPPLPSAPSTPSPGPRSTSPMSVTIMFKPSQRFDGSGKDLRLLQQRPRNEWSEAPTTKEGVVARPLSRTTDMVRGVIGGLSWGPALAIAQPAILSAFSQIEKGTLVLVDETCGSQRVYGQPPVKVNGVHPARKATGIPRVELVVKKESFWVRLFLFADMGFAEAYMLGEMECSDLTGFFHLFILNREQMGNGTTWLSSLSSAISGIARTTNTMSNALLNISAHYDISNDMFATFLSPDMTYSCPIWKLERAGDNPSMETLEDAQITKLGRFVDGCNIQSTDHVLEIGTGWGSFAMEAVKRTGCRVTSLTLSREQKALAEERIEAAGFSAKIQVLLKDYRALTVPDKPFDKIVSIEMLEAVGPEYLPTYFRRIHELLKKDGGIAMFQCITMPEGRHEAYAKTEDFINHYIFPGGHLPSITQLINHISTQSEGTLIIEKIENIGGHYSKTLRLWKDTFLQNFDTKIRPALEKEHPAMKEEGIEVFRRKWEYYFTYCEAGFLTKTLGDAIITVGREGALELMDGIPL
ncbi:cyclopropane-fatty-acyl-phospholipid synthase [Zalerion maritima]|uniref:Cyclopropane-fatty-acyl-phospholipid synthase n=1 Tax=Zalerion maritima TaxID=339359 RepID=A0AAD5RW58_9PEZI|nr:cyclopropane-fatty-acyl-phospholipid synthase [Zalerion maritima]